MRLKDCGPLKIILPGRANVRRRNIEIYFQTHGVEVADMIEMDAMISTLQFVAALRLGGDPVRADLHRRHRPRAERVISPIYDPPLIAEFVVISPARRTLSTQAQLFLECFEAEIARIQEVWAQTIPPAVYPGAARRADQPRRAVSDLLMRHRRRRARLLQRMRPREGVVLHAGVEHALEVRERPEIDLEEARARPLAREADVGDA